MSKRDRTLGELCSSLRWTRLFSYCSQCRSRTANVAPDLTRFFQIASGRCDRGGYQLTPEIADDGRWNLYSWPRLALGRMCPIFKLDP